MSVKDLIWVNVCQGLKLKRDFDIEKAKRDARIRDLEVLCFLLADIRAIARDSNYFVRVAALKGSGIRKLKPLPDDALPSVAAEKAKVQREEDEKLKRMTPEERIIYRFNKGEKVRG